MIVHDILHGTFEIGGLHEKFIKTRPFVRVRKINEFPFTDENFTGLVNTEYDHALGVFHIAGLLAENAKGLKEYADLIELAALMHYSISRPFEEPSQRAEQSLRIDVEEERYQSLVKYTEVSELISSKELEVLFSDAIDLNLSRYTKHRGVNALFNSIIGIKKLDYLPRDIRHSDFDNRYPDFFEHVLKMAYSFDFTRNDRMTVRDSSFLPRFLSAYHSMFVEVYLQRKKLTIEAMYEYIYEYLVLKGLVSLSEQCVPSGQSLPVFFTLHDYNQLDYLINIMENAGGLEYKNEALAFARRITEPYDTITRKRISRKFSEALSERALRERLKKVLLDELRIDNPFSLIIYAPMNKTNLQTNKPCNAAVFLDDGVCLTNSGARYAAEYFDDWSDIQYIYVYADESLEVFRKHQHDNSVPSVVNRVISTFTSEYEREA